MRCDNAEFRIQNSGFRIQKTQYLRWVGARDPIGVGRGIGVDFDTDADPDPEKEGRMLNLSVTTSLSRDEVIERALAHFVQTWGLSLVELVGHMHGREGAVEVVVSGERVAGNGTYEPQALLGSILAHVRQGFGLEEVYTLLHLHTAPDETAGHLLLRVVRQQPLEVAVECRELDAQTRAFIDGLPKA